MDRFEHILTSLSALAQDADITLIPVYSNIRTLGPEKDSVFWSDFWNNEFMSAAFAAVGHVFSKRLGVLSISSAHDIPNLVPHGSHPLLDPLYSSSDLRIRHEGFNLSRFEKIKLISDWDLALQYLRVCNVRKGLQPDRMNCCKCEKCLRTMALLLALGVLDKAGAFPVKTISEELVNQSLNPARFKNTAVHFYIELIDPLKKAGRNDLARAVEAKIDEFYQLQKRKKWREKTIEPIKEFDRKYFKGNLKKLKNSILV